MCEWSLGDSPTDPPLPRRCGPKPLRVPPELDSRREGHATSARPQGASMASGCYRFGQDLHHGPSGLHPPRPPSCSAIRGAPTQPTAEQGRPRHREPSRPHTLPWLAWRTLPNRTAGDSTLFSLMGPGITTSLVRGNRPRTPGYPSALGTSTLGCTAEWQPFQSVRGRQTCRRRSDHS